MRVKVFHSYPKWLLSGVNTWSANLALASVENPDFEHAMLITGVAAATVQELEASGIPYVHLKVPPSRRRREEWKALKVFLESNAPCIYLPNYDFQRASAVGTLSSKVLVCSVVHSDEDYYYDQIQRIGVSCNAVVAVSSCIENRLHKKFPNLSEKISRIAYGVPSEKGPRLQATAGGPIRMVYCNRLAQYQKRVFDLPEVCRELVRIGVDFQLTVAGQGPDEDKLRDRFEAANLGNYVQMIGRLPAQEVRQVLRSSDVFLLTSDFEGLPISLLEAMAAGCVPVAYDIDSGVRDAVDPGVNGILIPHGETSHMARALAMLAVDRDRLVEMSAASVERHAEYFSVETMAANYNQLFSRLMHSNRKRTLRDGRIRRSKDLTITYRIFRRLGLADR
jgi:glycosyltransferase involved in cell wall biosynthesis